MIEPVTMPNVEWEPEDIYTISTLETLKVASDPTRLHILETLAEAPMTVKQVARVLGSSPTKLYYHVNLLEEHGLIVVTGSRVVSGIIEKQYRTRSYSLRVDRALLDIGWGDEDNESLEALLSVLFDATRDDVRAGVKSGVIKLTPNQDDPERNTILTRSVAVLTPEQFAEFHSRLRELLSDMGKLADEHIKGKRAPGARRYGLTVALYPFAEIDQEEPEQQSAE
jgi:DNA-binding transcriptional ArsR family regulator